MLTSTVEQACVLGCRMPKSVTTADIDQLTFNNLLMVCRQKTNRDPVVDYDEDTPAEAVEHLCEKHLV